MKFSIGKGSGDLAERMRERKNAKRRKPGVTKRAKGSRAGRFMGGLFFSLFLLVGLAFGYFLVARPVVQMIDARDWPAVPATVTASDLEHHSDSDGTTYKIKIEFAYEFNGRGYTSDTYDFMSFMSSSGYDGKRRVVADHPVGKPVTAYVNPAKPGVAVLHRGWSHNLWFGAIPLVFVLVGGGGLIGMLWSGTRGRWATKHAKRADGGDAKRRDDWLPALARQAMEPGARSAAPEAVSPTKSRLGTLLFVLVFMLIWDGVTIAVLLSMFNNSGTGIGPKLFMIPFVLVGIGFLVALVYMLLALSNPRVRMRFDPRVVPMGQPLRVDWSIDGRAERIERLTMTVEGIEQASYTRGTDRITDEHTIFEHELYSAEAMDPRNPLAREGEAELQLPAHAMHSFESNNNKIVWRIKVKGEIPKWPDVKDEYEFAVVPAEVLDRGPNVRGMF